MLWAGRRLATQSRHHNPQGPAAGCNLALLLFHSSPALFALEDCAPAPRVCAPRCRRFPAAVGGVQEPPKRPQPLAAVALFAPPPPPASAAAAGRPLPEVAAAPARVARRPLLLHGRRRDPPARTPARSALPPRPSAARPAARAPGGPRRGPLRRPPPRLPPRLPSAPPLLRPALVLVLVVAPPSPAPGVAPQHKKLVVRRQAPRAAALLRPPREALPREPQQRR